VVDRAEHEVDVVGGEAPQVPLLLDQGCRVGRGEETAPHALGRAGRAARDVHRPGAGEPRGGVGGREPREGVVVGDEQCRVQTRQDPLPLGLGEPRVEGDRHHAGGEQTEGDIEVGLRARDQQGDPVTLLQAPDHARQPRLARAAS
jgi:hypothetical protein